jgi:hypothetical protein
MTVACYEELWRIYGKKVSKYIEVAQLRCFCSISLEQENGTPWNLSQNIQTVGWIFKERRLKDKKVANTMPRCLGIRNWLLTRNWEKHFSVKLANVANSLFLWWDWGNPRTDPHITNLLLTELNNKILISDETLASVSLSQGIWTAARCLWPGELFVHPPEPPPPPICFHSQVGSFKPWAVSGNSEMCSFGSKQRYSASKINPNFVDL